MWGAGSKRNVTEKDERLSYLTQWGICSAALLLHTWFLVMFRYYKITPLFYFNICSVLLYTGMLFSLAVHWQEKLDYVTVVAAVEIILHQSLCMYLLGLDYGFQQYMIPTAAYTFLYMTESKKMRRVYTVIASMSIVIYALTSIFFRNLTPKYTLPEKVGDTVYYMISLSAFAILIAIVWALSVLRRQSYVEAINKNKEIMQMAKSKEIFLDGISHEVRTPLNVLVGMTEQLEAEEVSEERKKKLSYMRDMEKGLFLYINDVLDLSKLETGKLSLHCEAYNPQKLVKEALSLFKNVTSVRGVALILDMNEADDCLVIGDAEKVKQILVSMIDNGVRYTKEGSVTLHVKEERKEDRCELSVCVEDTGSGIRPENMSKVMKLFTESENAKDGSGSGSGLRMALARMLAEWMGGSLKAESTYGKGSRFTFLLSQKIEVNS